MSQGIIGGLRTNGVTSDVTHLKNPDLLSQPEGLRLALHRIAMNDLHGVGIKVLGHGMEKDLMLSLGKYLLIKDRPQFLWTSLATLAKNFKKMGLEGFILLPKNFHWFPGQHMRMFVRMGVYPYEYMDSMEKMDEKQLLPN